MKLHFLLYYRVAYQNVQSESVIQAMGVRMGCVSISNNGYPVSQYGFFRASFGDMEFLDDPVHHRV
jgi:hypothetical protein